jgi:tRNA(adenine34) deaminase
MDVTAPIDDDAAMAIALEEARLAGAQGDVPIGAVVLVDGRVVSQAGNRREQDRDPTAHAEVLALRAAAAALGSWRLEGATLVVTLEPCPMCAGAIVQARVPFVVYGCADPKAGACHTLYQITSDARLNHRCAVLPGVLGERCADVLRRFFLDRRAEGKK